MKMNLAQTNLVVSSAIWLACVCAGFHAMLAYGGRPGPASTVGPTWPAATGLKLSESPYTLVLFLHPQCPCSNATLNELAVLLAKCPQIRAQVLFIRPNVFQPGWEKTHLWTTVESLPGATAQVDPEGKESTVFSAQTSGECALYDRTGRLRFKGGITGSRGHEGDNRGLSIIEEIVQRGGTTAGEPITPAFGCPLTGKLSEHEAKGLCLN